MIGPATARSVAHRASNTLVTVAAAALAIGQSVLAAPALGAPSNDRQSSAVAAGGTLRLGLCQPVLKDFVASRKAESLAILGNVGDYLSRRDGRPVPVGADAEVSVLAPPRHGSFDTTPADGPGGWPGHWYLGDAGYGGQDQFTVRVRLGQRVVDVTVFTTVVIGDSAAMSFCRRVHGSQVWRLAGRP